MIIRKLIVAIFSIIVFCISAKADDMYTPLSIGDNYTALLTDYYDDDSKPSIILDFADTCTVQLECIKYQCFNEDDDIMPVSGFLVSFSLYKLINESWVFDNEYTCRMHYNSEGYYTSTNEIKRIIAYNNSYKIVYNGTLSADSFLPDETIEVEPDPISRENSRTTYFTPTKRKYSLVTLIIQSQEPNEDLIDYHSPNPDIIESEQSTSPALGTYEVSETGAATYSMAIECPNHKLTPQIGIFYNSQLNNYGLVGYGINITGISSITRSSNNLFNDGEYRDMTFDQWNDNFLLDGKRLIPSENYEDFDPSEDMVYSIDGSPHTIVVKHGEAENTWFSILDSDGTYYEYGNSTTSHKSTETSKIVEWYIRYAVDSNNNYIIFDYEQDDYIMYPKIISYGHNNNTTITGSSKIEFEYQSLGSNSRPFFLREKEGTISKCLKSITTSTLGTLYRKYIFQYDGNSDMSGIKYTRLSHVTVQNNRGELLPSVSLIWNYLREMNVQASPLSSTINSYEDSEVKLQNGPMFMAADINGDGISDIIKIVSGKEKTTGVSNTYMYISLSNRDSYSGITYTEPIKFILPKDITIEKSSFNAPATVDFDGDGYNDFMFSYIDSSRLGYEKVVMILGKDVKNKTGVVHSEERSLLSKAASSVFTIADFNGDGKEDGLFIETNKKDDTSTYTAGLITFHNDRINIASFYNFYIPGVPVSVFSGDYNNDGLPDIFILHSDGYKIYKNNGGKLYSGSIVKPYFDFTNSYNGNDIKTSRCIRQGDFDGDGMIDFVFYDETKKNLVTARNNGNGTFTLSSSSLSKISLPENDQDYSFVVSDFDFDGCSDVMLTIKTDKVKTYWFYSNGTHLQFQSVSIASMTPDKDLKLSNTIFTGDFDGDGVEEVINYGHPLLPISLGNSNSYFIYRTAYNGYAKGKIQAINDGQGRNVKFNYTSLSNPTVYKKSKWTSYPLKNYTLPISVVSELKEDLAGPTTITTKYTYENLIYHAMGRGSLGFSLMSQHNTTTGVKQITEVTDWDESLYVPTEVVTRTIAGTDTATVVTTNTITRLKNTYISLPQKQVSTDMDGNTVTTEYTYDTALGVPSTTKTTYGEGMYTKKHTYGYTYSGRKYVPMLIDTEKKHPDDPNTDLRRTELLYDDNGNITQRTDNKLSSKPLTTVFTYDATGNVLSKKITGQGVTPITSHYEYDDSRRYVTRTYSTPASADIVSTYDILGNLLSQTDVTVADNHLTRTMTYDGWGRMLTDKAPDGTTTTYEYGSGTTRHHSTYVRTTAPDGSSATKWFDSQGRETLVKSVGPGGIDVAKATHYDDRGQVSYTESFTGRLRLTTSYTYDHRGRVLTTSTSSGSNTSYTYGNRMVQTNRDGRVHTTHTDAMGNVVSSSDPVSSVSYTYYSNGNPSSVTTDGSTVTMEYDDSGNRTRLTDPDAGVNTCTYAADGTLLSQTDARGITTTFTFDNLGRVTTTKTGDRTITNTYGTDGYATQRITRRASEGNLIDYTYDRYGRVVKEKRTVAGQGSFEYQFEYNTAGQLSKAVYPGGLEVTYAYDDHGHRSAVTADGQQVWQFTSTDGRTSRCTTLGTMERTHTVDLRGFTTLIGMRRTRGTGKTYADSIRLDYDGATGNLLSRRYNRQAAQEYAYDDMDRLLSVTAAGQTLLQMEYDAGGNILSKSDVGDYGYESQRPHAVTSVTGDTDAIPSATQTVEYDDIGKVSQIQEGDLTMTFAYGPDGERWHSLLTRSGETERETVYVGTYERITTTEATREFWYLDNGVVVVRQDGGEFKPCALFADEQGSVLTVADKEGNRLFEASYDAWGRQTVTTNTIGFTRGYTGHEMLPEFGIINMGGRLYDPVLGRFFSADNYVQQPDNSQNFNRYSYCLNNPLKYTDPTGQWFGIDDLIVFGVSAIVGYVSNGIKTGNWGLKSVKVGLMTGVSGWLGYNTIGLSGCKQLLGKYIKDMAINTFANSLLPTMNFPVNNVFGFSISPMFGLAGNYFSSGVNVSLFFNFGEKNRITLSFASTDEYAGFDVTGTYDNTSIGYGLTYYTPRTLPNGKVLGEQTVGTATVISGDFSLRFSNDCLGDKEDRWRSNAVEIGVKDFVVGTFVTTNWGKMDSRAINKEYPCIKDGNDCNPDLEGRNKGTWKAGEVYSAPLWIGIRNRKGNQVTRFGFSHPIVQNLTQNVFHRYIAPTPLFKGYSSFEKGVYFYSGANSPVNLW